MSSTSSPRSQVGAVILATSTFVIVTLPVFLTGATAIQMAEELRFTSAQLGIAVGMYRVTAAGAGLYLGRVADRTGATRSLRRAAVIATIGSAAIALTVRSWATLVICLMIGGIAAGYGQPAANRLLMQRVDVAWQGRALGLKQSAPPIASMIAGLSVPFVALTLGWRWAFGIAAVMALVILPFVRGNGDAPPPRSPGGIPAAKLQDRPTLIALVVTVGLANFASAPVPAFYVSAAVAAGSPARQAGFLLAIGSIAAIGVRLICGVISDRMDRGHLRLCAALVTVGALGLAALATATPAAMAIGILLALGGGWGYNAVFWFAALRIYRNSPATITGILSAGTFSGSAAGPVVFGVLVDRIGYQQAWIAVAIIGFVAAGAMLAVGRRVRNRQPN